VRAQIDNAVDQLVGSDPGFKRLRMALQAVLAIGVGLGFAYLFVRATGELQAPTGTAPTPAASVVDHTSVLISMLFAGLVALQAGFVIHERTLATQVIAALVFPIPMVAGLALGLLVGPYRVPSLAFTVVALAVGVYLRRFGQRGLGAGMALFFGAFFGFFLHTELGLQDAGWLAADFEIGAIASVLVTLAFFRPRPEADLARMFRSQRAQSRRVMALSRRLLMTGETPDMRKFELRIRRQLVRLNETMLMIDAQLAEAHPGTAAVEAQQSFDADLALSDAARFAIALMDKSADAATRHHAAEAFAALLAEDPVALATALAALHAQTTDDPSITTVVRRFTFAIEHANRAWDRPGHRVSGDEFSEAADRGFQPAVTLANGWLPGSSPVSTAASTTPAKGRLSRLTMPIYRRSTIQIAVAGTLAVIAGDAISGARVYWAILTVFVSFLMVSNSSEEVQRALLRGTGTAIGIVLGDLLVHLGGGQVWSSTLIVLVAMFFGIYLIRVSYLFMTIGITVMIAQLYVQLGELSWSLLLTRLAETAVGSAAVIGTVLVVLPLRPSRVFNAGLLLWVRDFRALLDAAAGRLSGNGQPLRPFVRRADATYAGLVTTTKTLRQVTLGRASSQFAEALAAASAAREYARSLVASLVDLPVREAAMSMSADDSPLRVAVQQMSSSLDELERRLATGERGRYVRFGSIVAVAVDDLRRAESPLVVPVRDLSYLDSALARLATALDMTVQEPDHRHFTGDAPGIALRKEVSV
jgi:uncharacterized membrane protein YccC